VLLWNLVAGSHIDGLGALCVVAALWALRRSGLTIGLALGAATAIKLTMGVFALPFAWSLRHDWRRLAATASAGVLMAAVAYAIAPQVVHNAAQVSGQAVVGSPWPSLLRTVLVPVFGAGAGAAKLTTALEVTSAGVLVILLLVALPSAHDSDITQRAARPALALVAGYLLGTAYIRPWYDAAAWLLLALLVRSWFDLVLLAHTVLMTLTFGPGLPYPLHPHWLTALIVQIGYRVVPALQALLLLAVLGIGIRRIAAAPPTDHTGSCATWGIRTCPRLDARHCVQLAACEANALDFDTEDSRDRVRSYRRARVGRDGSSRQRLSLPYPGQLASTPYFGAWKPPVFCSSSSASHSGVRSSNIGPMSCTPTGRPSGDRPAGTAVAGRPGMVARPAQTSWSK
jgi:hypothetical protein